MHCARYLPNYNVVLHWSQWRRCRWRTKRRFMDRPVPMEATRCAPVVGSVCASDGEIVLLAPALRPVRISAMDLLVGHEVGDEPPC